MVYGSPEILDRNPEVLFCWKSSSPIWGTTEVKKGLFGSAIKTLLSLLIHIPSHEGNWTLQAYINSLQSPSQKDVDMAAGPSRKRPRLQQPLVLLWGTVDTELTGPKQGRPENKVLLGDHKCRQRSPKLPDVWHKGHQKFSKFLAGW